VPPPLEAALHLYHLSCLSHDYHKSLHTANPRPVLGTYPSKPTCSVHPRCTELMEMRVELNMWRATYSE
jgi:hypothetical protein